MPQAQTLPTQVRVWDPWIRVLHWALALSVLLGWISGFGWLGLLSRHEAIGWASAAIVAARLVWGFFLGTGQARFGNFVQGSQATWTYWRQLRAGHAPRYRGHNPLGAWMIVALLSCAATLGLTGFLFTTDMFWGYAWLANFHLGLAWLLMGLVALHLSGVVLMSLIHHEALVLAMITGRKRKDPTDADCVEADTPPVAARKP